MNRLVFDIETLAYPLESFDAEQQEYLLKFAQTPEEREETIQKFALSPLTAQVIAIGMLNPDTRQGRVLFQGPGLARSFSADNAVEFIPGSEAEILGEFWKTLERYPQVITFNGRSFDGPFLMVRSSIHGIRTTRNLVPYRYAWHEHCDLLDQLSFYGASRKFNLDFYCRSFGISSPKAEGVTGADMGVMFAAGRYREIAEYCLRDVVATAQLFERWLSTLAFEK